MVASKSTREFVRDAIEKHGNRYDYSESIYVSSKKKIKIICKEHGSFLQIPNSHLLGSGCSLCFSPRYSLSANNVPPYTLTLAQSRSIALHRSICSLHSAREEKWPTTSLTSFLCPTPPIRRMEFPKIKSRSFRSMIQKPRSPRSAPFFSSKFSPHTPKPQKTSEAFTK